jgi:hypothetical protein
VSALSLLASSPISSLDVGADRNENGRHTSSAAAAHPSRTPSRAGSRLLHIPTDSVHALFEPSAWVPPQGSRFWRGLRVCIGR